MNIGNKIKTVNVGDTHAAWIQVQHDNDSEFSFSRLVRQLLDNHVIAIRDDKDGIKSD